MIKSPIFYMGNKERIIKRGLIELFPKNINMFLLMNIKILIVFKKQLFRFQTKKALVYIFQFLFVLQGAVIAHSFLILSPPRAHCSPII